MSSARDYERISALYDPLDLAEFLFKRRIRPMIFANLQGRILDVGAGTGCNIPHYPKAATMVAVDGSPGMLAQAHDRCIDATVPPALVAQDVMRLGFSDASFDAIVATWLFGVIPSVQQAAALAELARVCRPDGEIRIVDYTLARNFLRRFLMRVFWSPYQTMIMKCSFSSQPENYFTAAGLVLVEESYIYSDFIRMLRIVPLTRIV